MAPRSRPPGSHARPGPPAPRASAPRVPPAPRASAAGAPPVVAGAGTAGRRRSRPALATGLHRPGLRGAGHGGRHRAIAARPPRGPRTRTAHRVRARRVRRWLGRPGRRRLHHARGRAAPGPDPRRAGRLPGRLRSAARPVRRPGRRVLARERVDRADRPRGGAGRRMAEGRTGVDGRPSDSPSPTTRSTCSRSRARSTRPRAPATRRRGYRRHGPTAARTSSARSP